MTIDWLTQTAGIIYTTPIEDAEVARMAAMMLHTGDFVYNEFGSKLSHIVPQIIEFDAGDDTVTVCGLVVSGADLLPKYDWCPKCVSADPTSPDYQSGEKP